MVDVVNNSVNSYGNMKVQKPQVGIINPPGTHSRRGLYSDAEASQKFKEINRELSMADQKIEYNDKKKVYSGIFLSIGIVAAGLVLMQKSVIAKIKNIKIPNLFKRKI